MKMIALIIRYNHDIVQENFKQDAGRGTRETAYDKPREWLFGQIILGFNYPLLLWILVL
jgi:hypothetical protein